MGFISRKVLPACGNMCVCCPALRPSSQQPVKRYKKLLAEIFPKNIDAPPNDRKILKLCEYAARNPQRLPKIAKFLEQRSHKELRCEHINFIKIITETYSKLLCICKEQMAYFAVSLLNVIVELLEDKRGENLRIIGCQTLTTFIYSQADGTYAHSIENLVHRVCEIAKEGGEEEASRRLRAASLECLSSMVWFMREFSHLFAGFNEITTVALDNYDADRSVERQVSHHNWVNKVVRCETNVKSNILGRPRPGIRDMSMLTREEAEKPETWAKICIQKIVEMAKESSTMRRTLEPIFIYFDTGKHWIPLQGLSTLVLSDISYWVNGNEQAVIAAVIRHLDHRNVVHDPQVKSDIIQISADLISQLRSMNIVPEIVVVGDLCRHLRKSLQATVEIVGSEEFALNSSLQSSIQNCFLEIVRGMDGAQPLFDMMAITLEELPLVASVSRAMIGSLLMLAHIISITVRSQSEAFPDALLLQLMKAMMHPDPETRLGAHQIFSILLVRNPNRQKHDEIYEAKKWETKTASAVASAAALLMKLRGEKECNGDNPLSEDQDSYNCEGGHNRNRIGCSVESETSITMLREDQTSQLLSAFWMQANRDDNLPYNFEAIANSFSLTLLSSRLKSLNHDILSSFFQLPFSLLNLSLNSQGSSSSHQRSIFSMSTAMLGFSGKIYLVPELTDFLKSIKFIYDDPYLNVTEEFQIHVKHMGEYNSEGDQNAAVFSLSLLRKSTEGFGESLRLILLRALSRLTDLGVDFLNKLLSEPFAPDDSLLFGGKSVFDWVRTQEVAYSDESLSFDEECSRASSVGDDISSEPPAVDHPHFVPEKKKNLPSLPQVISVGQLLESALQVAGQVAGTCVSTSPLPYGTMASQCEALGVGTRKKFSYWLGTSDELEQDRPLSVLSDFHHLSVGKERSSLSLDMDEEGFPRAETCLALRLPPASPFDNFWKAARF